MSTPLRYRHRRWNICHMVRGGNLPIYRRPEVMMVPGSWRMGIPAVCIRREMDVSYMRVIGLEWLVIKII